MAQERQNDSNERYASERVSDDATLAPLRISKRITVEAAPILFLQSTLRFDFDTPNSSPVQNSVPIVIRYAPVHIFEPSTSYGSSSSLFPFMRQVIITLDSRLRKAEYHHLTDEDKNEMYEEALCRQYLVPFTSPHAFGDRFGVQSINMIPGLLRDTERFISLPG